jgi:hypothetical protein
MLDNQRRYFMRDYAMSETKKMTARVCCGCGKPLGVFCFAGKYWHLACFRKNKDAK